MADDAVKVVPHVYKPVLENARGRVLEIRSKPGETSELHSHIDMVLHAVTDCASRLTGPGGEIVDASIPQGQIIFLDATTHRAEDVSTSGSFAVAIELQQATGARQAAVPVLPMREAVRHPHNVHHKTCIQAEAVTQPGAALLPHDSRRSRSEPQSGTDTVEGLRDWAGLDDSAIEVLMSTGVVAQQ